MGSVFGIICDDCEKKTVVQILGGFMGKNVCFNKRIPVAEEKYQFPRPDENGKYHNPVKCPRCGSWNTKSDPDGPNIMFD